MSAEHTPGRIWLNSEHTAIVHPDDGRIACPPNHSKRWAWDENARRIVACWNACDGVDTDLLEQNPAPFSELRAERDSLLDLHKKHMELMMEIAQELKNPRLPIGQIAEASVRMLALAAKESLDVISKATGTQSC